MKLSTIFPKNTRQNAYADTLKTLKEAKIEAPEAETRLLLDAVFKEENSTSILCAEMAVTKAESAKIAQYIAQRQTGKPLAYVLGYAWFWGQKFIVEEGVLIPRMDSETLIAAVLEKFPDKMAKLIFAEMGVGSGCLLLTLILTYPNSRGFGSDISPTALKITLKNAQNLGVENRLTLYKGDKLAPFIAHNITADILLSNPPYIAENDPDITSDVRQYEPKEALFAKNNGLQFYQELSQKGRHITAKNSLVFLEIGHTQASAVIALLKTAGWHTIITKQDLAKRDRIICATY